MSDIVTCVICYSSRERIVHVVHIGREIQALMKRQTGGEGPGERSSEEDTGRNGEDRPPNPCTSPPAPASGQLTTSPATPSKHKSTYCSIMQKSLSIVPVLCPQGYIA